MEENEIKFEQLKIGMIFSDENTYWNFWDIVIKKSAKKVWFLHIAYNNYDKTTEYQTIWRRNYGDDDSFNFYEPSDFSSLTIKDNRKIIKAIFTKNLHKK